MIAIYARQSIDKKDSISIETQIEFCKNEANGAEFKIYQDKGYSGKNTNRPAFEQMMKDLERGEINKIIVYKLDRISRSIVDFSDFISTLEKYNAAFISSTEKFDTSAPMGRAMLYFVVVFAQLERETIAERVKDNYYERVKRGAVGGGPAPYGFSLERTTKDGNKITIYTENTDISHVKLIFDEYSKPHTSLADVQRLLQSHGITTVSGKPWDSAKLSTVLKSPAYVIADTAIFNYYRSKGAIIANDVDEFDGTNACVLVGKRNANDRKYTDVTGHTLAIASHPGIINSAQFLFCQEKLSKNKQIKNTFRGKYSWLTGLVKCGHCGYSLSLAASATKEGTVRYFKCSGKYTYRCCDVKQTHRMLDVEKYVENQMFERVENVRLGNIKPKSAAYNDEYQKQIYEIDSKIENLISTIEISGPSVADYINRRIEQLHAERVSLQAQHDAQELRPDVANIPTFIVADWQYLSIEDKRELARNMIKRVVLSAEGVSVEFL